MSRGCGCGAASVRVVKLLLIICLFVISGRPHQESGSRMRIGDGSSACRCRRWDRETTRRPGGQSVGEESSFLSLLSSLSRKGNKRAESWSLLLRTFCHPRPPLPTLSSRSPILRSFLLLAPAPATFSKETNVNKLFCQPILTQGERERGEQYICALAHRKRERKCRRGMVASRTV